MSHGRQINHPSITIQKNSGRGLIHLHRIGHVVNFGRTYSGDSLIGARGYFIKDGDKYRDPSWSTRNWHLDLAGTYGSSILKKIRAKEFIKRTKVRDQNIFGCVRIQKSIASIYFRDSWINSDMSPSEIVEQVTNGFTPTTSNFIDTRHQNDIIAEAREIMLQDIVNLKGYSKAIRLGNTTTDFAEFHNDLRTNAVRAWQWCRKQKSKGAEVRGKRFNLNPDLERLAESQTTDILDPDTPMKPKEELFINAQGKITAVSLDINLTNPHSTTSITWGKITERAIEDKKQRLDFFKMKNFNHKLMRQNVNYIIKWTPPSPQDQKEKKETKTTENNRVLKSILKKPDDSGIQKKKKRISYH